MMTSYFSCVATYVSSPAFRVPPVLLVVRFQLPNQIRPYVSKVVLPSLLHTHIVSLNHYYYGCSTKLVSDEGVDVD